ncbi:MAG TPA: hypothetical protein VMV56_07505 [Williamwhitmania sp.]|nr:hypothetical protein [Williamwhitmania sp.]
MKKETFFCDQCKHQVEKSDDLNRVKLEYNPRGFQTSGSIYVSYDLCSLCCGKLGFVKRIIKDDQIVEETQDVKDRIYNIVCQLIEEMGIVQE